MVGCSYMLAEVTPLILTDLSHAYRRFIAQGFFAHGFFLPLPKRCAAALERRRAVWKVEPAGRDCYPGKEKEKNRSNNENKEDKHSADGPLLLSTTRRCGLRWKPHIIS